MSTAAIVVSGVCKSYGGVRAVTDLDFTVPEGSVCGFLGPNGSGKTTTIRMIMSILYPDSGTITVRGIPAGPKAQDLIGYLPEERGLYPKMKVGELLTYFAALKNAGADGPRRIKYWLQRVELEAWADKKVNELSKGMQQKIQFIVSVLADPPLLILDEPSSGLDPVNANVLKDILLELRAAGKTILFSTHRMEEAERICDHIYMINRGRKVLDGTLAAVKAGAGQSAARIEFRGDGSLLRQAPGVREVEDYGNYAEMRLSAEAQGAEIVRFLAPRLDITRFELLEPSLNQIFLEKVSQGDAAYAENSDRREAGVPAAG